MLQNDAGFDAEVQQAGNLINIVVPQLGNPFQAGFNGAE